MGSVSLKIGDGTARFKRASLCSSGVNLLMLISVITTNLFAFYSFTYHPTTVQHNRQTPQSLSLISAKVSSILEEIESSQKKLAQMKTEPLLYESIDLSRPNTSNELKLFLNRHLLPLGKDSRTGIAEMVSSVGHLCDKSMDSLSRFMNYKVKGLCPDDWSLGQKLILQGCDPLPRRRCFAKAIPKMGLHPFPISLWKNVSDRIFTWSGLGCKTFACLKSKKLSRDCDGCFDIVKGYETQRYVKARSNHDFLIDDVIAMGKGRLGIGFDIGEGSRTLAARMAERNVTIVTASLNLDAPFNEFIASRGLFPLYMSLDQRFPFFDNVFDLVHIGSNALNGGGGAEKFEFLMFDVDRVLRAGGLFWLDNVYVSYDAKKRALTQLIERFGYKKLRWLVGEKAGGLGKSEVYLSAVLEKPVRV